MRRLRVTQTMRKRLELSRDARGNPRRGGVMVIPRMLSVAEFDALAVPSQERLLRDLRDDAYDAYDAQTAQPALPDPASRTHLYKPDPARPVTR